MINGLNPSTFSLHLKIRDTVRRAQIKNIPVANPDYRCNDQ